MPGMRVLGIETSCDETSAAVVDDGGVVRSNVVSSQMALHVRYGGVVPELAAREQVTAIIPVVRAALEEAGATLAEIDGIAVANRPGLAGSLLVGVNAAKAMGYAAGIPVVGVHHLAGHIAACWLGEEGVGRRTEEGEGREGRVFSGVGQIALPAVCLVVSGGHTQLVLIEEDKGDGAGSGGRVFGEGMRLRMLGETIDDAAGEAFDKSARVLGLGYPGGPVIERVAADGDPGRFPMPRAWLGDSLDFSFSGLKTALLREVAPYRLRDEGSEAPPGAPFAEHRPPRLAEGLPVADLAAGFQAAVVDVLATKAVRGARRHGARSILLAGGVAANGALRRRLHELAEAELGQQVLVRWPAVRYCTDNAAMIAAAGTAALMRGEAAGLDLNIAARAPLTTERVTAGG